MPPRDYNTYMIDTSQVQSYSELFIEIRITGYTLILELTILRVSESFLLDIIYLFYQSVVFKVLVTLFADTFWRDSPADSSDDKIEVPKYIWIQMGKDLEDGKKMTLSVCSRYPKNIDLHASRYKAED